MSVYVVLDTVPACSSVSEEQHTNAQVFTQACVKAGYLITDLEPGRPSILIDFLCFLIRRKQIQSRMVQDLGHCGQIKNKKSD